MAFPSFRKTLGSGTITPGPIGSGAGTGSYTPSPDETNFNAIMDALYAQQNAGGGDYGPVSYDYGDGGGGGGSYAVEVAAPPPPDKFLEDSPEWLAYLNALGLQKGQFAADIERQREIARGNMAYASAGIGPQFAKQRRNITSGAEGRGMSRSGELQRNLATSHGEESRAQAGVYQNLMNQESDLTSSLAQKNLDLDVQRAQQQAQLMGQGYKQRTNYEELGKMLRGG